MRVPCYSEKEKKKNWEGAGRERENLTFETEI